MKKYLNNDGEQFVIYELSDLHGMDIPELISTYVWNQGSDVRPNRDLIVNLLKTKNKSEIINTINLFRETELPLFVQTCEFLISELA